MVKDKKAYLILNKFHQHHVLTSIQKTPPQYIYRGHKLDWTAKQIVVVFRDKEWLLAMGDQTLENATPGGLKSMQFLANPDNSPITPMAKTFQWTIGPKDAEGFRHITADNDDYLYMHADYRVETSPSSHGDKGLWKFIPLPSLKDLTENCTVNGKSATEWKNDADYIFQEGLNFIGGTPVSSLSTPTLRQSWVDTWKKMGRDRGVYPHPQSQF